MPYLAEDGRWCHKATTIRCCLICALNVYASYSPSPQLPNHSGWGSTTTSTKHGFTPWGFFTCAFQHLTPGMFLQTKWSRWQRGGPCLS